MQNTDRLMIESGGKHQRRPLRVPTSPRPSEEGTGERDAETGDRNELKRRRRRRETHSIIETVMGFARSTCQGRVKMASVREEERDERMGEERGGQVESGSW
ncbi:unnamed protein product [Pleuronectes platessa]|uniref:Uncharacterized protein n=1 Tax=Pleuronectes platessa TaxID=8262 RepID=A0A9N7V613_PLEPL|nr:unnamed protein product [Pleuronectes platessa]